MKITICLFLLFYSFTAVCQNNPSTNTAPNAMEALRISTNAIVVTNAQNAQLNRTVWPQGISMRPITGRFVDVSIPFRISNGIPYQTVVIGIRPENASTLIDDVGSVSELIPPQIGSYGSQVTTIICWPQNPYWFELNFQCSQADTIQFFSTNFVSTNAPVAGTYTFSLGVTATNVTVLSQ